MTVARGTVSLIAPRLAFALLPLLALLVGVVGLIVFHQLQETTARLRTERLAYALFELRRVAEGSLALGLPLEVTDNLAPIMTAALDRDLTVLSIDLFDNHGRLLLSTDRFGIGESVPAEWIAAQQADSDGLWQLTERGAGVIGINVINSFGQRVGGLALRHRLAQMDMDGAGDISSLVLMISALVPVLLVLAWLGFGRALAGTETLSARAGMIIAQAEGDDGVRSGDGEEPQMRRASAFSDRVTAVETAIAEAATVLRRLDEED